MAQYIIPGVVAVLVAIIEALAAADRKSTKQAADRQVAMADKLDKIADVNNAQQTALMLLMLDNIRHIGGKAIEEGEISMEVRSFLHQAHDCYHNSLGGNGDADAIMKNIDALPLKI